MNKRIMLNDNNGKFTKALSVAVLAGLSFLGTSCFAGELENQNRQTGERSYNFESANDVYTVTENFGTTGTGKFTINGVAGEDGSKSTIDFDGHSGMNITNASDVTIKDVELTNAKMIGNTGSVLFVNNANAKVTLENVYVHDIFNEAMNSEFGGVLGANNGKVKLTNCIFQNNILKSSNSYTYGGVIENTRNSFIEYISGKFINNYAEGNSTVSKKVGAQGVISNRTATIGDIIADFTDNRIKDTMSTYGSAIYNGSGGVIGNISGNFINNSSITTTTSADVVGAIMLQHAGAGSKVNSIVGYFYNNSADGPGRASSGAINNNTNCVITEGVTADFVRNYAKSTGTSALARGGAVLNFGYTPHITGDFTENYAQSSGTGAIGGALAVMHSSSNILEKEGIDKLQGNYTGNYALATGANGYAHGGAVYNTNSIGKIQSSNFKNNYVKSETGTAQGGAIYNTGTLGEIVNSNFENNYAKASNGEAKGGAIYTSKDVLITSKDGFETKFESNYVEDKNGRRPEAIYVDNNATLTLAAKTNGQFKFNDKLNGKVQYNLKLKGDNSGKVYFNNDVLNANIEHNDVTTYVDGMKYLNHAKGEGINSLTMNSGTLNVGSFNLAPLHFEKFAMNGGTINIDKVDVDLANKTMGRITANSYGGSDKGTINVKAMNVLSDGEKEITPVLFADKSFKNTVKSPVKEAYTKLYRYDVSYDANGKFGEDGYFVFTRGGNGRNSSDSFNPAVLTSPVATQAGAQASMTNTLYYAFEHGDTFMNFSAMDRFAKINSNTYALAERQGALSTDFNSNLNLDYAHQNKGIWTKPYSSFESIHLKNGPKVDVISYGTLIGFDSDIHKLKRGWANVATAYIGYNGSQVDYSNVDASTNGGLLGLTETFYKGNFWTALTATAGASFAEAHTMYGKDEMTMLMAGIGSKTGYNFEFKEGKFIIQPRLFMSYSFVNTFDYTNSAGVRIDSDPMHTVQINPSVKFIGNIKGWQPYASVGMVWNLLNETHTEANGVKLPEMHTKPYVEYGVGLQRTWADKFSAYGQAMLRHGGRNGVALTLGFRWALGRDYSRPQKVQKDSKMSGDAKRASLLRHSGQDGKMLKRVQHDNTFSHQNATVGEGNKKVLKQLSPTQRQKLANTTTIVNNIYPQKAHLEHTTRTAIKANVEKL